MDHPMSMQPANMMGPLTQQMNHLSLGTTGTVSWRVWFVLFSWTSSIRCHTLFSLALSAKLVLYQISYICIHIQLWDTFTHLTRLKVLRHCIWILSYFLFLGHNPPGIMSVFLEKCLYTCTCKSRPCNLIHLNLFFFPQMLTTSANISFPGYS